MNAPQLARRRWRAIGTDCEVIAETEQVADAAAVIALNQLAELDLACSRFRDDSELSRLRHGTAVAVGGVLNRTLGAALRAARETDGLVDPTIGQSINALGYDADFAALPSWRRRLPGTPKPAPGHWRVSHDQAARHVLVPRGIELDLGATAKAWAVDRCATTLAEQLPGGFLVNFGGDLAVSGPVPDGGWRISLDDADGTRVDEQSVITIAGGALATSSTVRRTWEAAAARHHHIVDPRTGASADPIWRTVTVAARTCELANTASTAAVVLGTDAPTWLARRRLHARLLSRTSEVVYVGDWPADTRTPQAMSA
ncbi:MAG: FAD:protein FMN transferase [Propionibacteriaceae bacterium]